MMKTIKSSRAKRRTEPKPYIAKKLRSTRPRRRRPRISPVLLSSLNSIQQRKKSGFSAHSVDSTSCSYFGGEVSCASSIASRHSSLAQFRENECRGAEVQRKQECEESQFRRITRSYYKQKQSVRKDVEIEVSESSCVESNSTADCRVLGEQTSKLNKVSEKVLETERIINSEPLTRSEITSIDQIFYGISEFGTSTATFSSKVKENEGVSCTSCVELCSEAKGSENRAPLEFESSDISKNCVDANFTVSNSDLVVEQRPQSFQFDYDLGCTEQLTCDDLFEYSSSHDTTFSENHSEIFIENSNVDFSDYTPSLFLDSGSEFSEGSIGDTTPSRTYSLFLEFKSQLSRLTTRPDTRVNFHVENECEDQPTLVKLDDEDDEDSYQLLREREKRQGHLHDYTEEYGDTMLQQRSRLVHWIVEQCDAKEYQQETVFLGVSILDRFLSNAFFKNRRNLELVGIACLVLAIRIEENQPYNSVRQKNFHMGSDVYGRCEVVAMEWLVQDVLNFQCFLPTIYNFLWFYLAAVRADADVERRAKYLAVLSLSDHKQLNFWPSSVAAGLVILASQESNRDAYYRRVTKVHVRTKDNDLSECIKSLEWLLQFVS